MPSEMTGRERLTAVLNGETPDRIPGICLCNGYYTNHNPGVGTPDEFAMSLGADILDRYSELPYRVEYTGGVEFERYYKDGKTFCEYRTPVGKIYEEYVGVWGTELPFRKNSYIKELEDYKVLQYVFEHTQYVENYDWWEERNRYIGDYGLVVPLITECRSSLEFLMENDQLRTTIDLAEEPEIVEELLEVIKEKNKEACRVAAKSPAQFFNIWEDTSTTILSPGLFEKYVLPEMNEFTSILEQEGKKLIHHACGKIKALLPLMAQEKVAAFESITPFHTGNVEMHEVFDVWKDKFVVIGGIDPVFLVRCTMEELEEYLMTMIESLGDYKRKFILQNSDSLPPKVSRAKIEKFLEIAKRFRF
ncbi:MAG: uroporphyrinogen decarboxylase family protein [Ruminococcus sp.]|jgi:hypothetical protein